MLYKIILLSLSLIQGCLVSNFQQKQPAKQNISEKKLLKKSIFIELENSVKLGADLYRPSIKLQKKTLLILVPGMGTVSRRGEVFSSGFGLYEKPIYIYDDIANYLANKGFYVLSFDKRTCDKKVFEKCHINKSSDLDTSGIVKLAQDLDGVIKFVTKQKYKKSFDKIILLSNTQGSQVVALSEELNKIEKIILFSPILDSVDKVWINGLNIAANNPKYKSQKIKILNQMEEMKSLFVEISKDTFNDNTQIMGASLSFWRSWLDSSAKTPNLLSKMNKNIHLIFNNDDPFFKAQKNIKFKNKLIKKHIIDGDDKNFIKNNELDADFLQLLSLLIN